MVLYLQPVLSILRFGFVLMKFPLRKELDHRLATDSTRNFSDWLALASISGNVVGQCRSRDVNRLWQQPTR